MLIKKYYIHDNKRKIENKYKDLCCKIITNIKHIYCLEHDEISIEFLTCLDSFIEQLNK